MSEVNLFSGRLRKRSLPVWTPAPGLRLPVTKRLTLAQGELAQIHDGDPSIRYIATLELIPGTARGQHYHEVKVEHCYVVRGCLELLVRDVDSGESGRVIMEAGDLVVIQPRIAHTYRILEAGVAIEFAPTAFDPADIRPHALA
jgi:uncharacterized cupin superfamily protein